MVGTKRLFPVGIVGVLILLASLLALSVPPVAAQSTAVLVATPNAAPQHSRVVLQFDGFGNSELVSLWLTLPDLSVVALGDVEASDAGDGELELFIDASFPVGVHFFSARGNRTGALARTRFELTIGQGAANSTGIVITVDRSSQPQGECFTYTGTGYAGGETLGVWITRPDGTVTDLGDIVALANGSFEDVICYGRLAKEGPYAYTAYGKQSSLTGIAAFALERGDYFGLPEGNATLAVVPAVARQLDTVTLIGEGFQPGELISFWVTLPDGRVLPLFEDVTISSTFSEEIQLPPLPVGRHYFSAYGQDSGQRAISAFDLLPGDGEQ